MTTFLANAPPGETMPRFYSLASSARDGFLEICVRLRQGGVCSTYLHGLAPGESVAAFVRAPIRASGPSRAGRR